MRTISGRLALQRAEALSKVGGNFSLCFYPYSRKKGNPDRIEMKTAERCTMRRPLPHERFDVDGKNYFLFSTEDGQPRMCYRCLIRFIGFSDENYMLYKVVWYE